MTQLSDPQAACLRQIARVARLASLRIRVQATLERLVMVAPAPLCVAIVAATVIKLGRLGWASARWWATAPVVILLISLGICVWTLLRRRPKFQGSLALDRHYTLTGRLTSALQFGAIPAEQRPPMVSLALADACSHAGSLSARKAVPLSLPSGVGLPTLLTASLALILCLEVRQHHVVASAPTIDPLVLSADDIDLFRDAAEQLAEHRDDPQLLAALDRFNQLIADLSQRRIDRAEAFSRMEALERDLQGKTAAQRNSLQEGLRGIGDLLAKSDLAKPVAEALTQHDLGKAQRELKNLARKMRDPGKTVDQAALQRLRDALKNASQNGQQRAAALEERRQQLAEERDSLLRQRGGADAGLSDAQERLLRNKERALERLDRDLQQQREAARQLGRLDRELAQAAEDLLKELGVSADDLERGAEDINRMAREEMTDQQKEELRERLRELRDLIRQQGQGGQARAALMRRFSQAARGDRSGGDGKGQGQAQGQGQGQGGQEWTIGPGGKPMMVVQSGGMPVGSSGASAGQGAEPAGGEGANKGSKSWGTGHDPNLTGQATRPKLGTHEVSAETVDTGKGPNRSQVIFGAADRGFVSKDYKKVFTEYRTTAERAISREEIPAGYRFYVQRYFQLIRPRE